MSDRYFENTLPDFEANKPPLNALPDVHKLLQQHLAKLLREIDDSMAAGGSFPMDDPSVYTGVAGIAYFNYFLWKMTGRPEYLEKAYAFVKNCSTRGKCISFLCGDAGALSLNAVISQKLGHTFGDFTKQLENMLPTALADENDELLYGRAGYLYALLFARNELQIEDLFQDAIQQVVDRILESGRHLVKQFKWAHARPALMWRWHDKMYLGAAHGVCGIIHTLLMARPCLKSVDASFTADLKDTLRWIVTTQRFETGNLRSSVGSSSGDKLVQWCHGATALPHVLFKFCSDFPQETHNDQLLNAAIEACDVVWRRGLLRKGFGICHGSAGSVYALLAAYHATSDARHLHRALEIASQFCCKPENWPISRQPDRPYSLFEGSTGTAWLLTDLIYNVTRNLMYNRPDLVRSSFPAYEL